MQRLVVSPTDMIAEETARTYVSSIKMQSTSNYNR